MRSGTSRWWTSRGRSSRTLAAGTLLAVSAVGLTAPLVAAEDPSTSDSPGTLVVESVDARGDSWRFDAVSSEGAPTVTAGDDELAVQWAEAATDLVLVVDNARSLPNATRRLAGDAASTLVPGAGPIRKVAVVSTARQGAHQELAPSTDPAAVAGAIDGVAANGDAATWDAISRAAELLEHSDAPSKRVVAFVAAPDQLSDARPSAAEESLRLARAGLDVVVLPSGVNEPALDEIVRGIGGSLQVVGSDEDFDEAASAVATRLTQRFIGTSAPPPGDEEFVRLDVAAGDLSTSVNAQRSALVVGADALSAEPPSRGLLSGLLANPVVRWLAILLLTVAVVGFVWSLLSLVIPDADSLSRRLEVYDEAPDEAEQVEPEGFGGGGVTTMPLLQRAVTLTGRVADRRGLLESMEVTLERANLPLRAAEAVFLTGVIALMVGVLGFALSGNLLVGLAAAGIALMVPKAALDFRVRRRQKAFVAQLPDMLTLLAGTLKAGYSITQGFEAVSKEIDEPMGRELRRVVTEHRLGRTLEDALDATSDRMGSDDFAWTVMAIKIQREVGGNLAELLLTVANTMTQRERLRRDVNSLTAEGRISAIILGLLPPGLGVVMFFMNREYIQQLFTPGLGYVMVGAAVIAMAIGFAWMKKIITIEV